MEKERSGKGKPSVIRPSTSNPVLRQTSSPTPPARASKSNIVHSATSDGQKRPSTSNPLLGPRNLPGLPTGNEENVRVVVRVRPLSQKEEEKGCREVVIVDQSENVIEIRNPALELDREPKSFAFDGVFPPDTPQAELYNQVARPIVENVIEGYNGTIFAYGQTGTGKTYTMEGSNSAPELKGVIPNSFAQIFSHVSQASNDISFLVRVSYLEIYNEDVRDLLAKDATKKLDVKESFDLGVYVKDLSTYVVETENDMERIMRLGNKNRSVGSTNMNLVSSRSHAIFTITVECSMVREDGEKHIRMGKLNLVDLAGSERVSKTGATGDRLKEGAKINLSLSCLGNVISALIEGESHIPYRNSKLTRLLQDSLGGNARTIMIANIGPADYNFEETLGTLRYADRAKHIKNRARINEDPKDALLRKFENEIEELKRLLEEEDLNPRSASATSLIEGAPAHSGEAEEDMPLSSEGEEEEKDEKEALEPTVGEETILEIKGVIESQEKITSQVAAATEEKLTALSALKKNVMTWKEHQERKSKLQKKLRQIKKKIMIGGDNLLDKSQEQEQFLQRAMHELTAQKEEQEKLQASLTCIVAEKVTSEEKILDLQGTSSGINRKLRRCWKTYQREYLEDEALMDEEQYARKAIIDDIKSTVGSYQRMQRILDFFIPKTAQTIILDSLTYNEDNDCWSLPCIAYSGNNIEYTDQEPEDNSYLNRFGKNPGRQRNKLKRLKYSFTSLYDDSDSSEDGSDFELPYDMEEDEADEASLEYYEIEYAEGCEQASYDESLYVEYYEEPVEPTGDLLLDPEHFFSMLEKQLHDPTDIHYVDTRSRPEPDRRQTSHKQKQKPVDFSQLTQFTGDYEYGYDSDFAYS